MQYMGRIIATLAVVAVVSALLLTGINLGTSPVIEENIARMHREVLENFFPEMDRYESKEINGVVYDHVYDRAGELLGVMREVRAGGYAGPIDYYLAIGKEGEIKGINIINHQETPGIGDIIEDPEFQGNFVGKSIEDGVVEEVDTVTGATASTRGLINSVDAALREFAVHILGLEEEAVNIAEVPDGTYRGRGRGHEGKSIEVEVTVEKGQVVRIDILVHEGHPQALKLAREKVPDLIKEKQELEVDVATGATETSRGIMDAVEDALRKALPGNNSTEVE